MANELQTSDLLGAELLCGYKYFDALETLELKKEELKQNIKNIQEEQQKLAKLIVNTADEDDLNDIPSIKAEFDKAVQAAKIKQAEHEKSKGEELRRIISEEESRAKWFKIGWIVVALMVANIVVAILIERVDLLSMVAIWLLVIGGILGNSWPSTDKSIEADRARSQLRSLHENSKKTYELTFARFVS